MAAVTSCENTLLASEFSTDNLYQLVDNPARITRSGESILDLIISDSPGFFVSSGTLSPPANCDHWIIYANFNFFSILLNTVESFIPHEKVIIRPRDKQWITGQIRKAVQKRDRLLKTYSKYKSPIHSGIVSR